MGRRERRVNGIKEEEYKVCININSTPTLLLYRREDCKRTKHDSLFSPWKVLIGPFDWKDHSSGKEGAERYMIHNLPNCASCSGIYELGIAVLRTGTRLDTSKFDLKRVVPVYIGQADNVRTRLQQYGREGAHLENGKFSNELPNDSDYQGPKLFSDIFARGCAVVYRWAPMKDKNHAEKAEAQLLGAFDYAWNKDSNSTRRPKDVFQKLEKNASQNIQFPNIVRKLRIFPLKKMGVKIKPCNSNLSLDENNIFSRIFKIGISRPRKVSSSKFDLKEDHASICGVAIGHGSTCRKPPIEGRRRCAEHRGLKINGITSKLIKEGKIENEDLCADLDGNSLFPMCGFTFENGTLCDKKPVHGRKRCLEHKGRRIQGVSKSIAHVDCDEVYKSLKSEESLVFDKSETICGVNLSDGTFCLKPPLRGRKRCKEHKGMRITGSKFLTSID